MKKLLSFLAILFIELILLSGLTATQVKIRTVFNFKGKLSGNFYSKEISSEMEKILATSSAARPEILNFDSPEMGAIQAKTVNSSLLMTNEENRKEAEASAAFYESNMASNPDDTNVNNSNMGNSETQRPVSPKIVKGGQSRSPSTPQLKRGATPARKGPRAPNMTAGGFENIFIPATEKPPPYDRKRELDQILAGRVFGLGSGLQLMSSGAFQLPKCHAATVEEYHYVTIQAPRRETWTSTSINDNLMYLQDGGIIREIEEFTSGTIGGMGTVLVVRIKPEYRTQRQLITSGISRGGYDNYYENPLVLNFLTDEEAIRVLGGVVSLIHIRGFGDSSHGSENDARKWAIQQWANHQLRGFNPFTLLYLIRQPTGVAGNIKVQNSYSLVICGRASAMQLRSIWEAASIQESVPRQLEVGGLHFELYRTAEKLIGMRYGSWASLEGSACVSIRKLSMDTTLEKVISYFPNSTFSYWDIDEDREDCVIVILKQADGTIPDLTSMSLSSFYPIEVASSECTGVTSNLRDLRKFYTDNDSTLSKWIKQGEAKSIEEKGASTLVKDGDWHVVSNRSPIKATLAQSPTVLSEVRPGSRQATASVETMVTTKIDEQMGALSVGFGKQFEIILDRVEQGLARHAQNTKGEMADMAESFSGQILEMSFFYKAIMERVTHLEANNPKKRSSEEIEQSITPPRRRSNSPHPPTVSDILTLGKVVERTRINIHRNSSIVAPVTNLDTASTKLDTMEEEMVGQPSSEDMMEEEKLVSSLESAAAVPIHYEDMETVQTHTDSIMDLETHPTDNMAVVAKAHSHTKENWQLASATIADFTGGTEVGGTTTSIDSPDDLIVLENQKTSPEAYDDGSSISPLFDQQEGDVMVVVDHTNSQDDDEPMQLTNNVWRIKVGPDRGLSLNSMGQYAIPIGRGATATIPIPAGSKIECYGEVITRVECEKRQTEDQGHYIMASRNERLIVDGAKARQAGDVASAINSASHVWCMVNNRLAKPNVRFSASTDGFSYVALTDIKPGQPIYTAYGAGHKLQKVSGYQFTNVISPYGQEATKALERRLKRIEVSANGFHLKVNSYKKGETFLQQLAMMIHWGRVDEVQCLLQDNLRVEITYRTNGNDGITPIPNASNGLCFWDSQLRARCEFYQKPWIIQWTERRKLLKTFITEQLAILEQTVINVAEADPEVKSRAITIGKMAIEQCEMDNPSRPRWGSDSDFSFYNREIPRILWKKTDVGIYSLAHSPLHKASYINLQDMECLYAPKTINMLWEESHFCVVRYPVLTVEDIIKLKTALVSATLHQLNVKQRVKLE